MDWDDDGTPIVITSGTEPPATEEEWYLRRYPPPLPNVTNQRKLTVPFGFLYYPSFCIGKASQQYKEYSVCKNGRCQYSRITTAPEGQPVFVPDLWTNTFLYYLIHGYQNHFRETNDFSLDQNVLILPTINRIRTDLYGKKKGYDHSLFKEQLVQSLNSLKYTSFYWRDFYGDKVDKPVRLNRILDYELLPPQGGRREIRIAVLFSEVFEEILNTSNATARGGFRQLSLDELLLCKKPMSRRLYEMTMMNIYSICDKGRLKMTFKQFSDRFGLTGSRRKRPGEVLRGVKRVMDEFVSPITGVKFAYHGKDIELILSDPERATQHRDLGNPDTWWKMTDDD